MNKKILSLLFLLILLVTVTVSYAYFSQSVTDTDNQTNQDGTVDDDTVSSEIDSTLLDEEDGVIGATGILVVPIERMVL